MAEDLPVVGFADRAALRAWLEGNHATSAGVLVRIPKGGRAGLTFEDVLDEGLCFGWSESTRLAGDATHYLQRFTPRRRPGTTSQRNITRAHALVADGRMTPAGLAALGWPAPGSPTGSPLTGGACLPGDHRSVSRPSTMARRRARTRPTAMPAARTRLTATPNS